MKCVSTCQLNCVNFLSPLNEVSTSDFWLFTLQILDSFMRSYLKEICGHRNCLVMLRKHSWRCEMTSRSTIYVILFVYKWLVLRCAWEIKHSKKINCDNMRLDYSHNNLSQKIPFADNVNHWRISQRILSTFILEFYQYIICLNKCHSGLSSPLSSLNSHQSTFLR